MQLLRGFRFKMKVNRSEDSILSQWIGANRCLYNIGLIQRMMNDYRGFNAYNEQASELPLLKKEFPWMNEATTRLWVADMNSRNHSDDVRWHDARTAQYIGKISPMGYNFGAIAHPEAGSVDFETMREHVLAKGK